MKILFIGKSVLLEEGGEKTLVIGDLHLGFGEVLREEGIFVPTGLLKDVLEEFDLIFEKINVDEKNKLDKIILLGDLKHEFGKILRDEWNEVLEFLDYLCKRTDDIVIVKGNHDKIIEPIVRKRGIEVVDFYIWGDNVFVHGDRNFEEIKSSKIKRWFLGHAHPAIVLSEGSKREKYKCFLVGKFKDKEVYILPSFFDVNEGTDVRSDYDLGLAWDFDLNKFKVMIVSEEDLNVLDFGELRNL